MTSILTREAAGAALVVDLARIVGAGAVSVHDVDRLAYARDCWPRDLIRAYAGEPLQGPICVVWPETREEVARVLALANDLEIPIVPYGAGSGVAGGARPSRGGIAVDVKRMRAFRSISDADLTAECETGFIGERLERALEERGYTLGHFPSSIGCSTLGGWLAARSAGQCSTHYGKIEDMTLGLELVAPGRILTHAFGSHAGPGPDYTALILGSEGTFGVITAAKLRIRPVPEARKLWGFSFPKVDAGIEAIRLMLRAGLRPAVVRLYDGLDTFLGRGHGSGEDEAGSLDALASRAKGLFGELVSRIPGSGRLGPGGLAKAIVRGTVRSVVGSPLVLNTARRAVPEECLLVLGFEGQPARVAAEMAEAERICLGAKGSDLGPGPGEHWYQNRYNVSFKQSKAWENGLFTDTMEVAATWDRLLPTYNAVSKAIGRDAFVMAHFSHAYAEGCSIYFTFASAAPDQGDTSLVLQRYDRIWRNALAAAHEAGATASHHHGVGELKADAMAREHGPGGMRLFGALKRSFDPRGIMNPGKLGLANAPPRTGRRRVKSTYGLPDEIRIAVGEKNLLGSGSRTTVRPPDENALASVLRISHVRGTPVITDQTGHRAPGAAVRVDLSKLAGITRLSAISCFVEVEAGAVVSDLEAMLNRQGLTLGRIHPRAVGRSVGAGLARNLLVRRGTQHGDLDDLCFAARGLLADGSPMETRPVPRSATGPELDRALIGAEGRFGILTRATLRIAPVPRCREVVSFTFDSMALAIEHARLVLRRGTRPAAARLTLPNRVSMELAASSDELLRAELAIVGSTASELSGARGEGDDPLGGRFDAVVEIATPWSRLEQVLMVSREAGGGEAWVDFLTPEEAVVVARVVDRKTRVNAAEAGEAAGGRLLAGRRLRKHDVWEDLARAISADIDPSGVLRGRGDVW
ncbi:MAG: FAD-binding oxidoreductase [Deltaproteobacteria bacterium]|nr:FAD-binding oxidoreductase [Deltaproteobacteria bacterium]